MQLELIWPATTQQFLLNSSVTDQNPCFFCLESGRFICEAQDAGFNGLCFYWQTPEPVIINYSQEYLCRVNEQVLRAGERLPLRYGANIQVGHFRLAVRVANQGKSAQAMLPSSEHCICSDGEDMSDLPEIDELLPHAGFYSGYLEVAEAQQDESRQEDIIKLLELEYKRFLVWGEQNRAFLAKNPEKHQLKLPSQDAFLESVTERVKDKTMTECIFEGDHLINRVIEELMAINLPEIKDEEEKTDLLVALAPENIVKREKRMVSTLLFQELYKLGLDSHI